jgi:outer membrane scaffolding protein for murein synthesis (MipA/OmpV family)
MMNFKLHSSSLAVAAALLVSPRASAQDQTWLGPPQEVNMVGASVFGVPDYYGSSKYEAGAAPVIRYSWDGVRYVQFFGSEVTLNLVDFKGWRAGPLLRYRGRRDDDVEDSVVRLMRPVASATELGVFGAYHLPIDPKRPDHKFVFSADIVGNTNNVYEGATGNLRVNYIHPFAQGLAGQPIIGSIGFGMFFASSSFNRKYFGVSGSDVALFPALGGREFRPDGGWTSIKIPFSVTTQLNKQWLLTFAGRYERVLDDAEDSPVVNRRGDANLWQFGIAASYRF